MVQTNFINFLKHAGLPKRAWHAHCSLKKYCKKTVGCFGQHANTFSGLTKLWSSFENVVKVGIWSKSRNKSKKYDKSRNSYWLDSLL